MTVVPTQPPQPTAEQTASSSRPFFSRPGTALRQVTTFVARVPAYGYVGAALNVAAWICSWGRIGPWNYTFFPLWFGFILFLDGLNYARKGSSPLSRSVPRFVSLFFFSMPFWWAFEGFNHFVQNWHYILDQHYTPLAYFLLSTLAFSTVLPAVMEIAELLVAFKALRPHLGPDEVGPRVPRGMLALFLALGVLTLVLPIAFPRYAFGLIWLVLIFVLDPINNIARRKSILGHLYAGDWRILLLLPLAALCCGFCWEMWNYFALPKWYYTVPFFDSWPHYFEMPLPGMLGYLPFGVELFVMYQFLLMVLGWRKDDLVF